MAIDPNDLTSIVKSVEEAFDKERNRERERFTDVKKYSKGKYPMRYVEEHIGGHRVVVDSTPGHRVTETYHGSGTYKLVAEDGSEHRMVVGNKHEYLKQGYTLTVDQNGDIRIEGHARVIIGGGAHIEVKGDVNMVVTGNMTQTVGGDYKQVVLGNMITSVAGTLSTISQGDQLAKTGANYTADVASNYKMESGGTSDMKSGGNMTKKAPKIDLNP